MRFPGTITTPEDAHEKVLEYAARSLKSAGFLDIAFIGDSGGNQAGQKAVSEMLNKECYLIPTTIESGPTSGSTRVAENPASFIQPAQSAPV